MMKKRKIGFYSDASGYGGSETNLKLILEHFDYEVYDVFFFHKDDYPFEQVFPVGYRFNVVNLDHPDGVSVVDGSDGFSDSEPNGLIDTPKKSLLKAGLLKLIPSELKYILGARKNINFAASILSQYSLDVFFTNETSPAPDVFSLAAKQAGIPTRICLFAVQPVYDDDNTALWGRRWLSRKVLNNCSASIFNTNKMKQQWFTYIGFEPSNVSVIQYGIDLMQIEADAQEPLVGRLGIPEDVKIVGVTARHHFMKGHRYLIEAAETIVSRFPKVMFVLLGEGPEIEKNRKLIYDKNLEDHFMLLGFRDELIPIIMLYDLAVLPSVAYETFGIVNIEAMACGKPVVATDLSGIPEVVLDGETGLIVPPRDSAALSAAILRLLQDDVLRQRLGQQAKELVYQRNSIGAMMSSIEAVIDANL